MLNKFILVDDRYYFFIYFRFFDLYIKMIQGIQKTVYTKNIHLETSTMLDIWIYFCRSKILMVNILFFDLGQIDGFCGKFSKYFIELLEL